MSDSPTDILADDVEPGDLDTSDLIALIRASNGSLDAFLEDPTVRTHVANHDFQPIRDRSNTLTGTTQRIETGYDHIYVNVNTDPTGRPVELFARYGKSGGFTQSFTEAIQNLATLALQERAAPEAVVDQLRGIRSPKIGIDNRTRVYSIPDAIGLALERVITNELPVAQAQGDEQTPLNPVIDATAEDISTPADSDDGVPDSDPASTETSTTTTTTHAPDDPTGVPGGSGRVADGVPDDEIEPRAGSAATPSADPHLDIDPAQHVSQTSSVDDTEPCPECGSIEVAYAEGCRTCRVCGWSECI